MRARLTSQPKMCANVYCIAAIRLLFKQACRFGLYAFDLRLTVCCHAHCFVIAQTFTWLACLPCALCSCCVVKQRTKDCNWAYVLLPWESSANSFLVCVYV